MQDTLFDVEEVPGTSSSEIKKTEFRFPWWEDEAVGSKRNSVDLFSTGAVDVERFGSGCSAKWDLLGYEMARVPVGVTATELSEHVMPYVARYANRGGRVFVDSGAFGAFGEGRVIDFEVEVFPIYDWLLANVSDASRLLLVMPDKLGDQAGTLELQRKHLGKLLSWMDAGAECLFPIQDPGDAPEAAYKAIDEMVGGRDWTVGIPSNKEAWEAVQVVSFAAAVKPRRMHLLGLAKEAVTDQLAREIAELSPLTKMSCDACKLLAHVGKKRRLTDRANSRLDDAVKWIEEGGEGAPLLDLSTYMADVVYEPGFVGDKAMAMIRAEMGLLESAWDEAFVLAKSGGLREVLGAVDPDEQWAHEKLAVIVQEKLYRPWVRKAIAGPVRAYEVARLASGMTSEQLEASGDAESGTCMAEALAVAMAEELDLALQGREEIAEEV